MLLAARSLFARQGFAQTSTAAVAREAGTSESQLIKHFGSKEGLLQALFEAVWTKLNAHVAAIAPEYPDAVDRLRAIVRLLIAQLAADEDIRRLMLFEGRRIGSPGARLSRGFLLVVQGIDPLLKDARRAGRLRLALPPAVVRSLLIGAAEGLLRDRLLAKDARYPAGYSTKDIERAMNTLIDAFFATDRALRPPRRRPSARRRP